MKKIFFPVFLFFISSVFSLNAQDIFYPEIEPLLSKEQKGTLEKAVNILLKARGNENNANDIERKYSKFKKRGNLSAWISKTWEAKQQRIMAEKNYKQAYETIASVYSEIIAKGRYNNPADKDEALALNREAQSKFSDAEQVLTRLSDDSKETLENTPNEEIEKTLSETHNLKLEAIEKQIAGLQKIVGVADKNAISKSDDDLAWEKAKNTNTIDSYYEYLNNNPRGRHMQEANKYINDFENNANDIAVTVPDNGNKSNNSNNTGNENNPENNNQNSNKNIKDKNRTGNKSIISGNLIFKVQIAAAISEISQWMLSIKAPGVKDIEMLKSGIWFKYMVGTFGSYEEAAKFRNELRSHAPDAFIVVFNNGKQVQVTESMKNQ